MERKEKPSWSLLVCNFHRMATKYRISIVIMHKISHSSFTNGRAPKHYHGDAWIRNWSDSYINERQTKWVQSEIMTIKNRYSKTRFCGSHPLSDWMSKIYVFRVRNTGEKATNASLHFDSMDHYTLHFIRYTLYVIRYTDDDNKNNHYKNCVDIFSCKKWFLDCFYCYCFYWCYHWSNVEFFIQFVCTQWRSCFL